ncbi:DUF6527 family protein [Sphingomonas radiodurans]|uniref:DUF6527 family protein n=1 Tax=Sphingomonas radiodurans TaxID=2890321 RepID=UPI001E4E1180|nr:DUF6527 family protein [Sphingomonas radiodurans]WBH17724.1 DUF6527 family protein [Sphingomonas radiodurans]
MNLHHWWRNTKERWRPWRRLRVADGDTLPATLPSRDLVVVRDDGEDWSVGMRCPCGCGDTIELVLVAEAKPRWSLAFDRHGRPSLSPSVWRRAGCRSHFWVRGGRVEWCG